MGFPARYTHTPSECADLSDVQHLADLVTIMASEIDAAFPVGRF